jgi:7-cyano-7-deazaguanine reductase
MDTEEHLLNDDKALLPGSGVAWHQFSKPDSRILKTFNNPKKGIDFTVEISTNELTALCPLTSMPDFYTLKISYTPDEKCIESKSAKFYFHSYRSYGAFIETLANKIADDFVEACDPKYLKVELTMAPRGGIPITVRVWRDKRERKEGGL